MTRGRAHAAALAASVTLACGSTPEPPPSPDALAEGEAVFASSRAGGASNPFSCATCHPVANTATARIYPGADLRGVTLRPSFWGGAEPDLLAAVNACRMHMMGAPAPWRGDEREARVLYIYLAALRGPSDPAPFTLNFTLPTRAGGDGARGADVFARACAPCHGAATTPPVATFVPRLPGDLRAAHPGLDLWQPFYAHVRAGGFGAKGQSMPPFSAEILSDADIQSIAAFLGF